MNPDFHATGAQQNPCDYAITISFQARSLFHHAMLASPHMRLRG
jgi:hypothetical protein